MSYDISNISGRKSKPSIDEPLPATTFKAGLERVRSKLGKKPRKIKREEEVERGKLEERDPILVGVVELCKKVRELEARVSALES